MDTNIAVSLPSSGFPSPRADFGEISSSSSYSLVSQQEAGGARSAPLDSEMQPRVSTDMRIDDFTNIDALLNEGEKYLDSLAEGSSSEDEWGAFEEGSRRHTDSDTPLDCSPWGQSVQRSVSNDMRRASRSSDDPASTPGYIRTSPVSPVPSTCRKLQVELDNANQKMEVLQETVSQLSESLEKSAQERESLQATVNFSRDELHKALKASGVHISSADAGKLLTQMSFAYANKLLATENKALRYEAANQKVTSRHLFFNKEREVGKVRVVVRVNTHLLYVSHSDTAMKKAGLYDDDELKSSLLLQADIADHHLTLWNPSAHMNRLVCDAYRVIAVPNVLQPPPATLSTPPQVVTAGMNLHDKPVELTANRKPNKSPHGQRGAGFSASPTRPLRGSALKGGPSSKNSSNNNNSAEPLLSSDRPLVVSPTPEQAAPPPTVTMMATHSLKGEANNTTESLFLSDVLPLATSVVEGVDAVCIALGQAGSGKSYSLFGTPLPPPPSATGSPKTKPGCPASADGVASEVRPLETLSSGLVEKTIHYFFLRLKEDSKTNAAIMKVYERWKADCPISLPDSQVNSGRSAVHDSEIKLAEPAKGRQIKKTLRDKAVSTPAAAPSTPKDKEEAHGERDFEVAVSMYELHNDTVKDLLADLVEVQQSTKWSMDGTSRRVDPFYRPSSASSEQPSLVSPTCEVKLSANYEMDVVGLRRVTVRDAQEAMTWVQTGLRRRAVYRGNDPNGSSQKPGTETAVPTTKELTPCEDDWERYAKSRSHVVTQIHIITHQRDWEEQSKLASTPLVDATRGSPTSQEFNVMKYMNDSTLAVAQSFKDDPFTSGVGKLRMVKRESKLTFVDLAGSERLGGTAETQGGELPIHTSSAEKKKFEEQTRAAAEAKQTYLKESQFITKSTSALVDVLSALSSCATSHHIPYRSSKLTALLQQSLSRGLACVVLAHILVKPSVLVDQHICGAANIGVSDPSNSESIDSHTTASSTALVSSGTSTHSSRLKSSSACSGVEEQWYELLRSCSEKQAHRLRAGEGDATSNSSAIVPFVRKESTVRNHSEVGNGVGSGIRHSSPRSYIYSGTTQGFFVTPKETMSTVNHIQRIAQRVKASSV